MTYILFDTGFVYFTLSAVIAVLAMFRWITRVGDESRFYEEPILGRLLRVPSADKFLVYLTALLVLLGCANSTELRSQYETRIPLSPNSLKVLALIASVAYITIFRSLLTLKNPSDSSRSPEVNRTRVDTSKPVTIASFASTISLLGLFLASELEHWRLSWELALLSITLTSIFFAVAALRIEFLGHDYRRFTCVVAIWSGLSISVSAFYEVNFRNNWYFFAVSSVSFCCVVACAVQMWLTLANRVAAREPAGAAP